MPANEYVSKPRRSPGEPLTSAELAAIQAALDAGALSYLVGLGEIAIADAS